MDEAIAWAMLCIGVLVILYSLLSVFIEYKIFEETKKLEDKVNRMWDECYKQRTDIYNLTIGCSLDRDMLTDARRQIRKIKKGDQK